MIQRIQSVYLALATGCFGGLWAGPFLTTSSLSSEPMWADGKITVADNIGLLGLTVLGAILALVSIFLFKNRPLQGKLSALATLSGVMVVGLAVMTTQSAAGKLPAGAQANHSWGWALPVLGAVLCYLAQSAIKKDEKLVRSMDRLR